MNDNNISLLEDDYFDSSQAQSINKQKKKSPYANSCFCMSIFFSYMNPFLKLSHQRLKNKRNLENEDVYELQKRDKTKQVLERFLKAFHENHSLPKSLIKVVGSTGAWMCILFLISNVLQYAGPIFLNKILLYLEDYEGREVYIGYLYVGILTVGLILRTIFRQHSYKHQNFGNVLTYEAMYGLLFEKTLQISSAAKNLNESGKIITMFSMDATIVAQFIQKVDLLITAPINILICIPLLYLQIQWFCLLALGIPLVMLVVQNFLMRKAMSVRCSWMKYIDRKTKYISEYLDGIRILKYNGWESYAFRNIKDVRRSEMDLLLKYWLLEFMVEMIWQATPAVINLVVLGSYGCFYPDDLSPAKMFTVITLVGTLLVPLGFLASSIFGFIQAKISLNRITPYMNSDDKEILKEDKKLCIGEIIIEDGTFLWGKSDILRNANNKGQLIQHHLDSTNYTLLQNINLHVSPSQIIGVVGEVGAGKTSLADAILRELIKQNGQVRTRGSLAIIPQQPWIINDTVRGNIVIGMPWDQSKYQHIIRICELERDLDILPKGDLTEIGARGINLSGGQKQRVSIARALYREADIYIIDDCLSALDAHVAKNVFENVIMDFLTSKTRIFITHSLHFLNQFQTIIVLKNGQIVQTGSYSQLIHQQGEFSRLAQVKENGIENNQSIQEEIKEETKEEIEEDSIQVEQSDDKIREIKKIKEKLNQEMEEQLVKTEEMQVGSVNFKNYWKLIKFGSLALGFLIIFFFLWEDVNLILLDWWLGQWSINEYSEDSKFYIIGYLEFIGIYCLIVLFGGLLFSFFTRNFARNIFLKMMKTVFKAPLSWFDETPTGRIINRSVKDQNVIDLELPMSLSKSYLFMRIGMCTLCVFQILTTLVMIGIITPWFFLLLAVLGVFYYNFFTRGIVAARDTRRIESVAKSPIFSLFSECLDGLKSIRCFHLIGLFRKKMMKNIDNSVSAFFMKTMCNRWMNIRIELLGNLAVAGAGFFAILGRGTISPNLAGLAISKSLAICTFIGFTLKTMADTEIRMAAMERIMEYSELIPQERSFTKPSPERDWPTEGSIHIQRLDLRYRPPLSNVLKNITFSIAPNEKLGIVGRTGSGKSTLSLGLLRIIEPWKPQDPEEGRIFIDGVDIEKIGLHHLRQTIAMIPQDPVLFSGTIQSNIDPFHQYSQEQQINTLHRVCAFNIILNKISKQLNEQPHQQNHHNQQNQVLKYPVHERGNNFSLGERQLICLARALIKHPKILIMDEATASIDEATDKKIQLMIRNQLNKSTVITIAHRLKTIIEYDRILVLEDGEIAELKSPYELIQSKKGIFYELIMQGGSSFFQKMKALAKNQYFSK